VCVSAFMVVVGVWCSLTNRTAGGAMTMTLLAWLVSALGVMILAAVTTAIGAMIVRSAWYTWQAANNISPRGNPPYPFSFATGWTISQDVIYAVLALVGALYLRRRFDELAGRTPPLRRVRLPVHDQPVVATLPPPPRWVQQPLGTKPPRRTAVAQGVAVGESHANTQRARDFWSRR